MADDNQGGSLGGTLASAGVGAAFGGGAAYFGDQFAVKRFARNVIDKKTKTEGEAVVKDIGEKIIAAAREGKPLEEVLTESKGTPIEALVQNLYDKARTSENTEAALKEFVTKAAQPFKEIATRELGQDIVTAAKEGKSFAEAFGGKESAAALKGTQLETLAQTLYEKAKKGVVPESDLAEFATKAVEPFQDTFTHLMVKAGAENIREHAKNHESAKGLLGAAHDPKTREGIITEEFFSKAKKGEVKDPDVTSFVSKLEAAHQRTTALKGVEESKLEFVLKPMLEHPRSTVGLAAAGMAVLGAGAYRVIKRPDKKADAVIAQRETSAPGAAEGRS